MNKTNEHEPASQIRRGEQPPLVVQIAREAADRIMYWQQHHGLSQDRSYLIIRDAIEKAHQSGWHEGRQYQVEYGTPAQPQRSEQATLASEAAEKAAKQLLNEAEWHEDNVISVSGEIEPFIAEALRKQQLPLIEGYIRMFVEAILHGGDEHRLWLKEAGECFVNGRPMPERPCPCIAPASGAASGEHCPDCKQELTGDDMLDREVHGRCSVASRRPAVATSEPQEQWTWETVRDLLGRDGYIAVRDAHNAAVAAEREKREQAAQNTRDALELHRRAMKEREQAEAANLRLVEALEECVAALDTAQLRHARASKSHVEAWKHGKAALAQAKEQP